MKLSKSLVRFILFCVTVSCFSFSLIASKNNDNELKVYSSGLTTTLPTSINLNQVNDSSIRMYYSSLNSMNESELRGTNLLKNLKPILRNNFSWFNYTKIWSIYEITDRDWNLSPASEINGYNSSTNTISSYTYGTSATNSGTNPYVRPLYRDSTKSDNIRAWDSHSTGNYFNREHVWMKSYGLGAQNQKKDYENGPAGTDLHHLMASDVYVNNYVHNDLAYGMVVTQSSSTAKQGNRESTILNIRGTDANGNEVFQPFPEHRGDIARALFYMCANYNFYNGASSTPLTDPNLILSDSPNKGTEPTSLSEPSNLGYISTLLQWNKDDPVDEYEKRRNDLIYNNYQFNRNPFIDFPGWADLIWGDKNVTGYKANPSTDTINGFNNDEQPTTDYVSLEKTSISLEVGSDASLTASSNGTVSWNVSPSDIISLTTNGNSVTINAINPGTATITASFNNLSASCFVTVTAPSVTTLSIDKTSLSLNEGGSGVITANKNASWSASPQGIVKLSSTSGSSITVNAIKEGTCSIIVSDGGTTLQCVVSVSKVIIPSAETRTMTIKGSDTFSPSLPTAKGNVTSSTIYKHSDSSLSFGISYAYLYQSNFLFFSNSNVNYPFIYNKESLGMISEIKIAYSSTTGVNGKVGIYFSSNELSNYQNSDNTIDVKKTKSRVKTNDISNYGYFQIAIADSNVQIASIEITYSLYTASLFASEFLTTMNCDPQGIRQASSADWLLSQNKFNTLNAVEKDILRTKSANINGDNLEKCVHQYDYIINKYGTNDFPDYMQRLSPSQLGNVKYINDKNSQVVILIATLSFSSIIFGAFILTKKRDRTRQM